MTYVISLLLSLSFFFGGVAFADEDYARGYILVSFSDNTPLSTAKKSLKQAKLRSKNIFGSDVRAYVDGNPKQLKKAVPRLSKQSKVRKVSIIPNENRIEIQFTAETTKKEAEKILSKENLKIGKDSFFRWSANFKVYVPKGKELDYVNTFSKMPIVKNASTDRLFSIPDCSKGPC